MKELLLPTLLFMWFFSFRHLFRRVVVLNRFLAFLATVVPTSNRRTHLHGYHHLINSSTSSKASSESVTPNMALHHHFAFRPCLSMQTLASQRLVIVMTKLSHSVQPFPPNVTDHLINSSLCLSRPYFISTLWYRFNMSNTESKNNSLLLSTNMCSRIALR